ncbi:hypothetical protein ACROYT_G006319 [Oculina patagonica]
MSGAVVKHKYLEFERTLLQENLVSTCFAPKIALFVLRHDGFWVLVDKERNDNKTKIAVGQFMTRLLEIQNTAIFYSIRIISCSNILWKTSRELVVLSSAVVSDDQTDEFYTKHVLLLLTVWILMDCRGFRCEPVELSC